MRHVWFILPILAFSSLMPVGDLPAADPILPTGDENTEFSLGVNNLPWNAGQVAFRWWRDDRGRELALGNLSVGYDEWNEGVNFKTAGIRYVWLRRERTATEHPIHITRGLGVSAIISLRKESSQLMQLRSHLPLGVEHFFLEQYPGVSYSLEADLYGEIEFVANTGVEQVKVSVGAAPRFFLRIYFD